MSLIVAKKFGDKIFIVSDTRLDNPQNLNRVELDVPEAYGLIKSLIINPIVCISYAGDFHAAKEALSVCRSLNYRVHEITKYLLTINKKYEHKVDFIVAVSATPYLLFKIKNGEIEKTDLAWIGDIPGFSEFQKHYHSGDKGTDRKDPQKDMEEAMTTVIESQVLGVNGFLISVSNESGQFFYKNYVKTYFPPRTITGNGFHLIGYGTAQEGGYTIHILQSEKTDVLAVHIPQSRMGIIYRLQENAMLDPLLFLDVDEFEFIEVTNAQYGIQPQYSISSQQKSYFESGNKDAEFREFNRAIRLYELALEINEHELRPEIYFNMGVCNIHLKKLKEGTDYFIKAVNLKPALQPKVFQFMSGFQKR